MILASHCNLAQKPFTVVIWLDVYRKSLEAPSLLLGVLTQLGLNAWSHIQPCNEAWFWFDIQPEGHNLIVKMWSKLLRSSSGSMFIENLSRLPLSYLSGAVMKPEVKLWSKTLRLKQMEGKWKSCNLLFVGCKTLKWEHKEKRWKIMLPSGHFLSLDIFNLCLRNVMD